MVSGKDLKYLNRCVELAEEAVDKGDAPFGSVLVSEKGDILFEDHNHISDGDNTQHPEFAIARWAADNLSPEERTKATVYTSGEHCSMCSSAHGLVGLGRIVYASSSKQLVKWQQEMGIAPSPIYNLSIQEVIRDIEVDGPVPELAEKIYNLHKRGQNN